MLQIKQNNENLGTEIRAKMNLNGIKLVLCAARSRKKFFNEEIEF